MSTAIAPRIYWLLRVLKSGGTLLFTNGANEKGICTPFALSDRQGADKCLEAPHLKAVAAVVRVAGIEPRRVEVQVHGVGTANGRRPVVPVVADVTKRAEQAIVASVAEARGDRAETNRGRKQPLQWMPNRLPAKGVRSGKGFGITKMRL